MWPLLALSGAVAQAAYSTGVKVLLRRVSPYLVAGASFLPASGVLFLLSYLLGFPVLWEGFLSAVAATVAINVVATVLSYRALAVSDLSLCLPMLAFTPVFLLLTSFFILGEVPSAAGILGICLVAAGSYLLAAKGPGVLAPLRTLSRDTGVRMMLAVAFLYSISVNYDKVVVETSDPVFGSAVVLGLLGAVFLALAGFSAAKVPLLRGEVPRSYLLLFSGIGLILVVEAVSVNLAYTLSIVPYVISIKRLSIFFAVLFGGYLLREGNVRARAAGSLVMVAGTVTIALWG
ncbi:MAG: EamA-like transporter family protein [Methanoregulaceae archaeon PtaU1.Bin222]|nr:MAG: EamA-like transporter family protein [Methanoregulaceae archaeon PtaU1.Bin222]